MQLQDSAPGHQGRWTSLWVVALVSLFLQLALCQFFTFGQQVPLSIDVNPSNLWKMTYHFPPTGSFQVLNWLGMAFLPQPLNPFSLAAHLPTWWFFTFYVPVISTMALLAMTAFLRELEISRLAALFGGIVFAWQGDILSFIYPGHYAYMTTWPFFAIAAWAALRAQRTRYRPYALISGACCGLMVGLQPDRGAIASLMIAALYLAPVLMRPPTGKVRDYLTNVRLLLLCTATAAVIALAPLLALFQTYVVGVKMAGVTNREQTYKLVTQYSLGPAETLTYLIPGFFGWHINSENGPYWGWVGEWPGWEKNHQGTRNMTLAISTTGTMATTLALIGICLLLPGRLLGPDAMSIRQRFFARFLLASGLVTLVLAWGWHTGLYRPLFALPLMDKWRNPLKWLEMTNFALVTLSALGMQHILTSLETDARMVRRRVAWFIMSVLLLLVLALIGTYPLAIVLSARLQNDGYFPNALANIMSTLHTSVFVAIGVLGLGCAVLFTIWHPARIRTWSIPNPWLDTLWHCMLETRFLPLTLMLALAALAVGQLAWVADQFIVPWPTDALTATNPLLEQLRSEGDRVRVSVATEDNLLDTLLENQFALFGISSLDISAASRVPDDLTTFHETLDDDRARLWFLAGVKNVALPQQDLELMRNDPRIVANIDHANGYTIGQSTSPDLPTHALMTMKDYMAKATFVPKAEFFAKDEKALLKRLDDPAWNPRISVLLADPVAVVAPGKTIPATSNQVDLKTYTPTDIVLTVQAKEGGYVFINDQYDPDWQVQVNGQPAKLLRADYIMRAVEVPAGESTVTMRYVAHYHVAGMNLPAATMNNLSDGAMLAAWLVAGIALRRKKSPVNP